MVCWSVCHMSVPCKNGWVDQGSIRAGDSWGWREHCIKYGSCEWEKMLSIVPYINMPVPNRSADGATFDVAIAEFLSCLFIIFVPIQFYCAVSWHSLCLHSFLPVVAAESSSEWKGLLLQPWRERRCLRPVWYSSLMWRDVISSIQTHRCLNVDVCTTQLITERRRPRVPLCLSAYPRYAFGCCFLAFFIWYRQIWLNCWDICSK